MCGGSPSLPAYQPPPKESDAAVQEAIRKERELALKRKGRQSTILTDLGSQNEKKTLLGA
jgi:hypothetical protein